MTSDGELQQKFLSKSDPNSSLFFTSIGYAYFNTAEEHQS